MKTYLFILLFLCVSVLGFSQNSTTETIEIYSTSQKMGAFYSWQTTSRYDFQPSNTRNVGKKFGINEIGRGYFRYDMKELTPTKKNAITGAKLVVNTGFSTAVGNHSVKISRLYKSDIDNFNAQNAYQDLANINNKTLATPNLTASSTLNVTIPIQDVKDSY